MDTIKDLRLSEAIQLIEAALDLLDRAGAPADLGARLADVLARLEEQLACDEAIEAGERKKSVGRTS